MDYAIYINSSYALGLVLIGGLSLHTFWQWRTTRARLRRTASHATQEG